MNPLTFFGFLLIHQMIDESKSEADRGKDQSHQKELSRSWCHFRRENLLFPFRKVEKDSCQRQHDAVDLQEVLDHLIQTAQPALQMSNKKRNVGRSHTRNARGLPNRNGSDSTELLSRFVAQSANCGVIPVSRDG